MKKIYIGYCNKNEVACVVLAESKQLAEVFWQDAGIYVNHTEEINPETVSGINDVVRLLSTIKVAARTIVIYL